MVIVAVVMTIDLFDADSLKEKRAVVHSLVERLRTRFGLAVAEVGLQEQRRRARVGFAAVSESLPAARHLAEEACRFADADLLGRAEVVGSTVEEYRVTD